MRISAWVSALVVALAAAPGGAKAQDGWSGYYAGIEGGIAHSAATMSGTAPSAMPVLFAYDNVPRPQMLRLVSRASAGGSVSEKQSAKGFQAGVFAGYDHQFGNLVFGALADIDGISTKRLAYASDGMTALDMDWVATVRVRAGWAASQRLLVFATAGAAFAKVDAALGMVAPPVAVKAVHTGYVFGAGAEFRFADHWSVKGEYMHHDFGKIQTATTTAKLAAKLDTFKIGLAYRF